MFLAQGLHKTLNVERIIISVKGLMKSRSEVYALQGAEDTVWDANLVNSDPEVTKGGCQLEFLEAFVAIKSGT